MNVFEMWEKAKPHLERALEYSKGTHTIDDVCLLVGSGRLRLWVGDDCAMATEFNEFPRGRKLNVFLAGGSKQELIEKFEEPLLQFARENACNLGISELGRRGWARALPGVQEVGVALHRDI